MRGNEFLDKMERIDPAYVEEADNKPKKKKSILAKWGAMAACLCLVIAFAIMLPRFETKDTAGMLASQLADMGINSEEVTNPHFVADHEEPEMTQDDLMKSISNNVTIQGTILSIESVRIEDSDAIWYLTTAEITVDEVLNGEISTDKARIVCGACYRGTPVDEQTVPTNRLTGCQEGTSGVFVLRELSNEPWTICSNAVMPTSLGDYYIVYYLDRSDDVLTYTEQNISVSIQEIGR